MHDVTEQVEVPEGTELPRDPVIHHVFMAQISEAAKIIARAQATAAETAKTIDQSRETACQEGFKTGYDAGIVDGISDIAALADQLRTERCELRGSMVDIIARCTKRLIARTPHRTKITALVTQAVEEANQAGAVAICVSPASRSLLLSEVGTETMKVSIADQELDIEVDASLADEDCLIVYPRHVVDARLEVRLNALITAIQKEWSSETLDGGFHGAGHAG